ncbi:RNA-directed DNA polymerase from transposon X-element [Oopsacas minuta]|uniref:RNA-directed DNA polymerase from transposon X-element n=1 Tax=Oopsacas minuta TaxID=111878 RepID=A0AAV7K3C8_9METZ|nr:RNA-directed DNA polymerase from transposon X-element [Oopsacas minuta]
MTISNSLDILIIKETWLIEEPDPSLCMLRQLLPDFRLTSIPRAARGGLPAILYRSFFTPKVNRGPVYSLFEYLDLNLSSGKFSCLFISFYQKESPFSQFILDFSDLIECTIAIQIKIILAGDFNLHFDLPSDPHTVLFNESLRTFDLQQHITSPTHHSGHTLDFVII